MISAGMTSAGMTSAGITSAGATPGPAISAISNLGIFSFLGQGDRPSAIVTIPPYAPFIREVAKHPVVSGLRLNTVMPIKKKDSLEDVLKRIQDQSEGKTIWIDLKCRQLRTMGYWAPPFTEVQLSHEIKVNTPVKAYFRDKQDCATLVGVEGNRLIFLEGPRRVVGPGESVTILDPSLEIKDYLTRLDKKYLVAGPAVGIHTYMASFVEQPSDRIDIRSYDPKAMVAEKIESKKGIEYVQEVFPTLNNENVILMLARGDMFLEAPMPHDILKYMKLVIQKDPHAICASRIFDSFKNSYEPTCPDITDAAYIMSLGYKNLMLGDEICQARDSVLSALNLMEAVIETQV